MKLRLVCLGVVFAALVAADPATSQVPPLVPPEQPQSSPPQPSPNNATIKVTSSLVFLDVTVLDKKGRPVTSGLTKDDFTITEDKTPQTIFSFEAPDVHNADASGEGNNPNGKAPATILVLDLLNSRFEDFAFIRQEARDFFKTQPAKLSSPTELLVVGNKSLEMLQGFTRNKDDLLDALEHAPHDLPYKENGSFGLERFAQSIDALDQIALQNKGVPGRKNIIWMGHGAPNVFLDTLYFTDKSLDTLKRIVHSMTNALVDARVSLFVIYPGIRAYNTPASFPFSATQATIDIRDDPFAGDVNFGVFANETGGKLFYNRNDLKKEIAESKELGSKYYTLTYQPTSVAQDGSFQRVRVTLRNPDLRVVTKAGYYAPDANSPVDPQQQLMMRLAEAAQSTIPFDALGVVLSDVKRHPDARTAECTVELKSKNVTFEPFTNGAGVAQLIVAAASLDQFSNILAYRTQRITLLSHAENPTNLPDIVSRFPIYVPVPRKTRRVRVTVQIDDAGGRIGSAELSRATIDAAPASDTPRPQLQQRPPTGQNGLLNP
jgi:VWFA-related protein